MCFEMHQVMEVCSSDVGEDTVSGNQNVCLANHGSSANAPWSAGSDATMAGSRLSRVNRGGKASPAIEPSGRKPPEDQLTQSASGCGASHHFEGRIISSFLRMLITARTSVLCAQWNDLTARARRLVGIVLRELKWKSTANLLLELCLLCESICRHSIRVLRT